MAIVDSVVRGIIHLEAKMQHVLISAVFVLVFATPARAQLVRCIENSPERHGQPGCTVIADQPMQSPPPRPAMWHIDEFSSLADARRAAGPNSVAFDAFGSAWLYTIESDTADHHCGKHRATVGPLPLREATPYSIQVLVAYFQPGNFSIVHTHSGPEAWWVLEGEQCLETTKAGIRKRAGEGAIVEEGETMRMVGLGNRPRRSLVLVLHDSNRPPATVVDNPPPLKSCQ
jgi:quercetin dioxygenase-like cupin family protein